MKIERKILFGMQLISLWKSQILKLVFEEIQNKHKLARDHRLNLTGIWLEWFYGNPSAQNEPDSHEKCELWLLFFINFLPIVLDQYWYQSVDSKR